jgi:hypothetical protein
LTQFRPENPFTLFLELLQSFGLARKSVARWHQPGRERTIAAALAVALGKR